MNQQAAPDTSLRHPDAHAAQQALMQARQMFQRTLGSWVCDLLQLRQAGMRQPAWPAMDSTALRRAA